MIKLTKKYLIFSIFLIVLISSCSLTGNKDSKTSSIENVRTGKDGIAINFLPNAPQDVIHVEQGAADNSFKVVIEIRNKGAYPQPDEPVNPKAESNIGTWAKLYLGGYDNKIIKFDKTSMDLSDKAIDGKSTINPNGGYDLANFDGNVQVTSLNVEKYEPTLLATICYNYHTVAGPSVCIDPDPYSTVNTKKVCTVKPVTLTDQGGPIAVTKIDEEAFAGKTQFRITLKNVGGGDVVRVKPSSDFFEKCDPAGSKKVEREDIDKVYLLGVKISDKLLECGPYAEGTAKEKIGYVRLINGEGFVICELPSTDYSNKISAYTTPIKITLSYGYRTTAEKKITIKKETSGLGTQVSDSGEAEQE